MQIIYKQAELALIVQRALAAKFGVAVDADTQLDVQFGIDDDGEFRAYVGVGEPAELTHAHTGAPWDEVKLTEDQPSLSTSLSTTKRTRRTKAEMDAFRAQQAAEAAAKQAEVEKQSETSKGGENVSANFQAAQVSQPQEVSSETSSAVAGDPAQDNLNAAQEAASGNEPVQASLNESEQTQNSVVQQPVEEASNQPEPTTGTDTTQTQSSEAEAAGDAPPARRVSLFAGLKK